MKKLIISLATKQNFLPTIDPQIYDSMQIDEKKTFIKKLLNSLCIDNNLPEISDDNIKFEPLLNKEKSIFDIPCHRQHHLLVIN